IQSTLSPRPCRHKQQQFVYLRLGLLDNLVSDQVRQSGSPYNVQQWPSSVRAVLRQYCRLSLVVKWVDYFSSSSSLSSAPFSWILSRFFMSSFIIDSSNAPRICVAKMAAFFAPAFPMATVAVGTPPGICTIDRSESKPFNALL